MNRKNLFIECEMLEGNINRIMVTDDIRELEKMYTTAILRLTNIYTNNKERIIKRE